MTDSRRPAVASDGVGYDFVTRVLHWVTVIFVAAVFAAIVIANSHASSLRHELIDWHRSLGLLALGLIIVRVWRFLKRPGRSASAAEIPTLMRFAATAMQATLLLCVVAQPLLGWSMSSARGVAYVFGGAFPLPPLLGRDRALADELAVWHTILGWVFLGLVAGHVMAALFHHFLRRDQVMIGMMPPSPKQILRHLKGLRDLPIRAKIMIPTALLAGTMAFLVWQANDTIGRLVATTDGVIEKSGARLRFALEAEVGLQRAMAAEKGALIADAKSIAKQERLLKSGLVMAKDRLERLSKINGPAEEREWLAAFRKAFEARSALSARIIGLVKDGDHDQAATLLQEEGDDRLKELQEISKNLSEAERQEMLKERDDAVDRGSTARWSMTLSSITALLLGVGFLAWVAVWQLARPLGRVTDVVSRVADGDLNVEVEQTKRSDEVGRLLRALQVFRENMLDTKRLTEQQAIARAGRLQRQEEMEQHTESFGASVSAVMTSFMRAADEMREAANAMAQATQEVYNEASTTSDSALRSSTDLAAVAAAVEELSSTTQEISRQVLTATVVTRRAVEKAEASQQRIRSLSDATTRISDVVRLISDIARKTNLLALNATIEAALAGEAGKGFAVVAGEVKALAAQTGKATAEITSQIDFVRAATQATIDATSELGTMIGEMDHVSTIIASAMEEQNATTSEIAGRLQGVSATTVASADAMGNVVRITDQAGSMGREVLSGATGIGQEADRLRQEVESFLVVLRNDSEERRAFERNIAAATEANKHAA